MPTGAITSYLDVAQIVLYAFWIFFVGLILYLRREDKREGYPLESDLPDRDGVIRLKTFSLPPLPEPKTFLLAHGDARIAPSGLRDERSLNARPVAPWPGAALQPIGDPMQDGLGAAAYAERVDVPDLTIDGLPRVVPLRVATDYSIEARDPDPRGMQVFGANGALAGTVSDVWVDRSETLIRYLEVTLADDASRRVLLPMTLAKLRPARSDRGTLAERTGKDRRREIQVRAVLATQFAAAPRLRDPDQVTLREEDRIMAFFGGGHRFATPGRLGPWL